MTEKPTYEELEKKVKELEKETLKRRQLVRNLRTFETAVESSINAIGITDLEGKLTYVNDSCLKMWGYNSKDEMIGRFLPDFWEGDGVFRTIKELREKSVDSGEGVGKRKDGSLFFVQFSASMFKDEAGNPSFMFGSFFDITKRKQADRTIRESEERLAAFMDSATDGFILFDSELNYIKMNKAAQDITGVDRKDITGKNIVDVVPDIKDTGRYDKYKKVIKTGVSLIIPELIPHPKFGNRYINLKAFKVGAGLGVIFTDITERKRAEEALRESSDQLQKLSDASFDGIVIMEKEVIQEANQTFADLFGYEPSETIGMDALDFIAPESKDIVRNNIIKGYEKRYEATVQKKDGEKFYVEACGTAITYKGRPARITAMRDITKRKQAEEALRESEKRFRSLVETMTDGLGIQDENGLITYVNNKFCQMLGYKTDDFFGRSVSYFLDDKNKRILNEQISDRRKGKTKPYELVWDRKDGSKISTMMSPQAIFDEKKQFKGSFSVITDISDLKRMKKELKKAHDKLEQRVKERTEELKIKSESLEELNTAMKVLLKKREDDRIKLEDNVLANTKELIEPLIVNMRETKLNEHQKIILSIIESNLDEITSNFTQKLSMKNLYLTPTEMKIANLIKHGTTTKQIAEIMKSSPRTIETHRKNIRRKIGLDKNRANLRSFLFSLH